MKSFGSEPAKPTAFSICPAHSAVDAPAEKGARGEDFGAFVEVGLGPAGGGGAVVEAGGVVEERRRLDDDAVGEHSGLLESRARRRHGGDDVVEPDLLVAELGGDSGEAFGQKLASSVNDVDVIVGQRRVGVDWFAGAQRVDQLHGAAPCFLARESGIERRAIRPRAPGRGASDEVPIVESYGPPPSSSALAADGP